MADTLGSLIDKICIAELKIYHMQEQVDRPEAAPEHRAKCGDRLKILTIQRDDLAAELSGLIQSWSEGKWTPKVYRQFKMYNDPNYKLPSETPRVR